MQISSINLLSFQKTLYKNKTTNALNYENPNPSTQPPLPPGSKRELNNNYIFIQDESNNEELAINENPNPTTPPPLPPGYYLSISKK